VEDILKLKKPYEVIIQEKDDQNCVVNKVLELMIKNNKSKDFRIKISHENKKDRAFYQDLDSNIHLCLIKKWNGISWRHKETFVIKTRHATDSVMFIVNPEKLNDQSGEIKDAYFNTISM
jgi:hypothetical protein